MRGRFVLCSGLLSLASSLKLPTTDFGLKQGQRLSFRFKLSAKSGLLFRFKSDK